MRDISDLGGAGVIATLLNGYGTHYLKKNLRGHPRRPRRGGAHRRGELNPISGRIHMRKIILFGAALFLIGIEAWVAATIPRVAASNAVGIDPFQMMINARDLPTAPYSNECLCFN